MRCIFSIYKQQYVVLYRHIITKCACRFPKIIDTLPKPDYVPSTQPPSTFFKSPAPSPHRHPSTYSPGPLSSRYSDASSRSCSPPVLFACTCVAPPHPLSPLPLPIESSPQPQPSPSSTAPNPVTRPPSPLSIAPSLPSTPLPHPVLNLPPVPVSLPSDTPPSPPLSPLPHPLLTPAQPEYAANITLPLFTNLPSMPSLPPNSAAHVRTPFLVVSSSPAPPLLNIKPRLLLAAMSVTSNLAKNLWPSFSHSRPTLPTPLTFNMLPTPSLSCSVLPPPPSTPLHELTPPQHLSPAITSPGLSESKFTATVHKNKKTLQR